jgi:hypothetical protein
MQSLEQINDQFSSSDLFNAFKIQLAKDFEQSNFSTHFIQDLPTDFGGVQEKIAKELELSKKMADATTMALLNRIDISEAQLKQYVQEHTHENQLMTIAELIIKRVLQKVVIKQYYKRNEYPEQS